MAVRLAVVGTGYLGLTHAVSMAELGHGVLAVDVDEERIAKAARGELSFHEPGLEPLLRKNLAAGRLRFTTSFAEVGDFAGIHFLCVGTPQRGDSGVADLSQVRAALDSLAPCLSPGSLIVGKSTVPPGTARGLLARARAGAPAGARVDLAWNPEFLREGRAVDDSLTPDRLVFGVGSAEADRLLRLVYATPIAAGVPALTVALETAELVKVAANSFLATKISFINAMAEVCEAIGADVTSLAEALGLDERIGGRCLASGLGFGGGCLPKDLHAFRVTARDLGVGTLVDLLTAVDTINLGRRARVTALAREAVGGDMAGTRVAVLGVAFKPGSDDTRDSPSLDVCRRLAADGAIVSVHDPVALPRAAADHPELRYADSPVDAAEQADVVLHLTEWPEYQALDPAVLKQVVSRPVLVDARCALDAELWRSAGWTVRVPGRP